MNQKAATPYPHDASHQLQRSQKSFLALFGTLTPAAVAALGSGLIAMAATPFMGAATFSYSLLVLGLWNRRRRVVHAWYMNSGIAIDLAIVLTLEFQRQAINTALAFSMSPLQQAHIAASSVATALYIPVLWLGWQLLAGTPTAARRKWHRRLAISAFIFRTLGFVLMFALLGRPTGN